VRRIVEARDAVAVVPPGREPRIAEARPAAVVDHGLAGPFAAGGPGDLDARRVRGGTPRDLCDAVAPLDADGGDLRRGLVVLERQRGGGDVAGVVATRACDGSRRVVGPRVGA